VAGNLSVMRGPLDAVTGRVNAAATLMERTNIAGAALAVTMSTVATALVFSTRAAIAAELSMARVEGVLKATDYAAGLTAKRLEDMAQSIAFSTLASVEGVRNASAQLLTFKTVSAEVFERTLMAAQDLAETGFGTVENGAVALGKAMENPAVGLTSLREKGISFSDQQKQQIEDWVRLGESAKAAGAILEIVEGQVGGVAKEVADATAAGDIDTLAQSFTNLGIAIADTLKTSDLYRKVLGGVTNLAKTATENINNSAEAQVRTALARVAQLREAMAKQDRDLAAGLIDYDTWAARRENTLINLSLAEGNYAVKRAAYQAEVKRQMEEETRVAQQQQAAQEKQRAEAQRKLEEDFAKTLAGSRQFVAQQIEISKQGGFGAGGGDPRAAEAAR